MTRTKLLNKPLRPEILREGQSYFDEPVYVEVSCAKVLPLEVSQAVAVLEPRPYVFGTDQREAKARTRIQPVLRQLSHYNHVRLRWVRPGQSAQA